MKVKLKKVILIICILSIILISFSGCYDARGIEDFAYVSALGIDISENEMLLLTIRFIFSH